MVIYLKDSEKLRAIADMFFTTATSIQADLRRIADTIENTVSDEDINKEYPINSLMTEEEIFSQMCKRMGAQWMREQITKAEQK